MQVAVREIRRAGMLGNVTIQSFDWGARMRMHQVEPRLPIVALTNGTFLQAGQPGASPWLGGIDIGGDGIITDYPDRLQDLLKTRSYPLPRRFEVHR